MKETDIEDHILDPDQENVIDQNIDQNQNLQQMNDPLSQVFDYSLSMHTFKNSTLLHDLFELKKFIKL